MGFTDYLGWSGESYPETPPLACYQLADSGQYIAIASDAAGCYYSSVLPGFWLDPEWLKQEPLPKPLAVVQLLAPQALRAALGTEERR
jgi:hypothetical protein